MQIYMNKGYEIILKDQFQLCNAWTRHSDNQTCNRYQFLDLIMVSWHSVEPSFTQHTTELKYFYITPPKQIKCKMVV